MFSDTVVKIRGEGFIAQRNQKDLRPAVVPFNDLFHPPMLWMLIIVMSESKERKVGRYILGQMFTFSVFKS